MSGQGLHSFGPHNQRSTVDAGSDAPIRKGYDLNRISLRISEFRGMNGLYRIRRRRLLRS